MQQGGLKQIEEGGEGEGDEKEKEVAPADQSNTVSVMGSLHNFVSRLDDEYVKALQKINPHTHEYVERLRMESQLVDLCQSVQRYVPPERPTLLIVQSRR